MRIAIQYRNMLPLAHMVCTVPQAQKLRKLGVTQTAYHWHFKSEFFADQYSIKFWKDMRTSKNKRGNCAAFNVAELGIMLPEYCFSKLSSGGQPKFYCCIVQDHKRGPAEKYWEDTFAHTEAEARAEMLIYCIEKKLPQCTIAEVNERIANAKIKELA